MVEYLHSVPKYRGKGSARGGMGKQGRKSCTPSQLASSGKPQTHFAEACGTQKGQCSGSLGTASTR